MTLSSPHDQPELEAALRLVSRLCHDLIGPLGSVTGGLEMMRHAGTPPSPEFQLAEDSAKRVDNVLRFQRLAMGYADPDQMMPAREVITILQDMLSTPRVSVNWQINAEALPRPEVRLILLLAQALCFSMPVRGQLSIQSDGAGQSDFHAETTKFHIKDGLEAALTGADTPQEGIPLWLLSTLIRLGARVEASPRGDTSWRIRVITLPTGANSAAPSRP